MLDLVLRRFGDADAYERAEAELGRSLTLNETIALEFSSVRAPLEEVVDWLLERTCIRPGFAELALLHRPLVVSSGFRELIEAILGREGVAVDLLANRVAADPEGWRVDFRTREPCAVCAEPCKRCDLPTGFVVYAGDGYADFCAALAADRVFATSSLARRLAAENVPFAPLRDFFQLADALALEGSSRSG
jgi:2-hydroxy-3-keto-5-methylthiopentenyl-1-phosphate phosphatase